MQLLRHLVERRPIEDTALREAHPLEGGHEVLGIEVFVAGELDAADGRPLDHRDDEGLAIAFEPHVAEEAGPEQRADRPGGARAVDDVSDLDRKIVEYGAGGDALETFQADVLDDERIGRRGYAQHGTEQDRGEGNAWTGQCHHQWLIVARRDVTIRHPSSRARSL